MSGKGEKQEKTSGSKMLKKAQSFREDLKNRMRRRPSTGVQQMIPDSGGGGQHGGTGGTTADAADAGGPVAGKGRTTGGESETFTNLTSDEMEKLKALMAEVNKTLIYIKAVVSTGKTEVLPGSASIILETVMQIFNELRYPLRVQESNSLGSSQSKVCQNLAAFIAWTDNSLVGGDSTGSNNKQLLDQEQAKAVINALLEGLEELTKLGLEKMSEKRSSSFQAPAQQPLASPTLDRPIHTAPETQIPLTPREKEILAETSPTSVKTNSDTLVTLGTRSSFSGPNTGRASNSSSVFSFESASDTLDGLLTPPPPKPPLPPGHQIVLSRGAPVDGSSSPSDDVAGLVPPPLPEKKRSPSASSELLDSLSAVVATRGKPAALNNSVSLDHSLASAGHELPVAVRAVLAIPTHGQVSSTSVSSSSSVSFSTSLSNSAQQQQQHSVVQQSTKTVTTHQTFSRTVSDSKLSSSGRKGKTCDEINQLTDQIKELTNTIQEIPPPLPAKKSAMQRLNSQYDNIPETIEDRLAALSSTSSSSSSFSSHQRTTVVMRKEGRVSSSSTSSFSNQSSSQHHRSVHQAFESGAGLATQETYSSSETFSSNSHSSTESLPKPPPLPPKKKHVQDYMQTFGALTQPAGPAEDAISRHSITFYESLWQQHQRELSYPRSNTVSIFSSISSESAASSSSPGGAMLLAGGSCGGGGSLEGLTSLPALPIKVKRMSDASHGSQASSGSSQSDLSLGDILLPGRTATAHRSESPSSQLQAQPCVSSNLSEMPHNQRSSLKCASPSPQSEVREADASNSSIVEPAPAAPSSSGHAATTSASGAARSVRPEKPDIHKDSDSDFSELNLLDDVEIEDQLVFKKEGEEGPEVRGGAVDALIVHATQAGKIEFMYQEAFLTTYRMFISPKALLEKLLYRFHRFQPFHNSSDQRKKLAHNAFSLLIRVVDELGLNELDSAVTERLMSLVHELICDGTLQLARPLRRKLLEKCQKKVGAEAATAAATPANSSATGSIPASVATVGDSQDTLVTFKSLDLAEQMTLLDSQLFQKIEIPEVLLWPSEQSEELSPHLTMFTEHFNKMSYWCRTRILMQEDPRDREKYHIKFIKIMRHLKELHNFNSYLAILSAVDSAPVRRLEWPEKNLEILHKLGQLIDSRSSFKAYRQALAETDPPCIPYLGLILQDLTFVNYGNPDKLPDGNINFAKHWQQFNILDSMRRFRSSNYRMARNERILAMFNNFEDYMQEEPLWQLSQKIKPRGAGAAATTAVGHKKQNSVS